MFGKPEWFRPKDGRRRLYPTSWQGWLYACIWIAAIAGPFSVLVVLSLVPEAIIWLLATGGFFVWDVWQVRRGLRAEQSPPEGDVFEQSERGDSTLDTRGFSMRLRR